MKANLGGAVAREIGKNENGVGKVGGGFVASEGEIGDLLPFQQKRKKGRQHGRWGGEKERIVTERHLILATTTSKRKPRAMPKEGGAS